MSPQQSSTHLEVADAGWRWVLDQVRWDDGGPWIPESVVASQAPVVPEARDGMHSGVGGLAHVLAEIRLARPWTAEEVELADAIAVRVRAGIQASTECDVFDGLVSAIGVLSAVGAAGTEEAIGRLSAIAEPDGWPQSFLGPPRYLSGARVHDMTLGTASVLLGAIWAGRGGTPGARVLAERAVDVLLVEAEPVPTGTNWSFVPERFWAERPVEMPNLSHGLAGIAATLALAGLELDRRDLIEAALSGAEHLVTLGDASGDGFVVPHYLPLGTTDEDPVTYTWCHGPTGTSSLFLALDRAGLVSVAGEPPLSWHRRCLHSVRTSGLPARLRPGFWDNDGRCCGTAGVGDVFLDSWQRAGLQDDLDFAVRLADVLVERAVVEGPHAWWRFLEHRAPEPLLPPGVGWMQGAAGIAAYLFRVNRLVHEGPGAGTAARVDTWWTLPPASSQRPGR